MTVVVSCNNIGDKMKSAEGEYEPLKLEEKIENHWKENKIFEKYLKKDGKKWYWLDGPPFTSGEVHIGTALNKVIKDAVLRYMTMRGYAPRRQPGWDMHGLPIEVRVESELKIKNKKDIENKIGVNIFIDKCKEFAIRNMERMQEQFINLGVWLDWDNPYMTINKEYMEAEWWSFKRAWEKDLLAKDLRVIHWCPRCETALAEHEIRGEYRMVKDPSVFVKFKLKNKENEYIVIWTTTPWTLPANIAVCVHPDFIYAKLKVSFEGKEEYWIMAKNMANIVLSSFGVKFEIVEETTGRDLEGVKYEHPFLNEMPSQKTFKNAHIVILGDHVTLEEGTGCVHTAPGHGEEDFEVGKLYNLPAYSPLDSRGRFTEGEWKKMFVKDADPLIVESLKKKELLIKFVEIEHKYPFCWRCGSPLIFLATKQWFLRVSKIKEDIIRENEKVEWIPGWAAKRYVNGVENVGDWCVSRQRYWGVPLPVWVCEKCGKQIVIGSIQELKEKSTEEIEIHDLHRPSIDPVQLRCDCGGVMKRVGDVLDVWLDSGSAPWASLGYPEKKDLFEKLFPADFIVEGHDQITKWFYSQQAASVITFDTVPYRKVQMHGFTLDEKGEAMHKSKGNAIPPEEVIEKYGRDTFRFYLLWAVAPWEDIRVSWEKIQSVNRMLKILWNVYKFSTTYMVLDNFDPETKYGDIEAHLRIEDRWMLSKINSLTKDLLGVWDTFYFHKITRPLYDFIVDDLSRWYIKLVRSRTWIEKDDPDKRAAYFVLCHALKTLSKLMAPITPYISEAVFTNMENKESVHLTDYPKYEERLIDSELNEQMNITRKIVESTAFARQKAEIKLRWPVSEIVIDSDDEGIKKAIEQFEDILLEQTNSKKIVLEKREFQYKLIPNYKIIGPKLKQDAEKVVTLLEKIDGKVLHDALEKGDFKIDTFVITKEDVDFELLPPEGYEFVSSDIGNVFVNKTIDAELKKEAYTREVVRRIQQMRKEMDLNIEDYIKTSLKCRFDLDESYIKRETRTESLAFKEGKGYYKKWEIDSEDVEIWIEA